LKQKVLLILAFGFLALILIGLNAASYSPPPASDETEYSPNRSTYNPKTTGTQAFYTLLAETGRNVTHWQEPIEALLPYRANKPRTFVAIGPFKREFTDTEVGVLLEWVSLGGELVLIDRDPKPSLFNITEKWKVFIAPTLPIYTDDKGEHVAKFIQPSKYANGVNSVQTSKHAAKISIERLMTSDVQMIYNAPEQTGDDVIEDSDEFTVPSQTPIDFGMGGDSQFAARGQEPPPSLPPPPPKEYKGPVNTGEGSGSGTGSGAGSGSGTGGSGQYNDSYTQEQKLEAPIVPLAASDDRDILVEQRFGNGRIVILTDPYVVSNSGINQLDNLQFALNLVGTQNGQIAFDEYHHGFGSNNNRFLEYFSGTPVIPIFLQVVLLIVLLMFSRSRRFGRAVPEPEPNRLSKLEYVSAMAELQYRTNAFDLALENIYGEFRRRVSRLFGIDNASAKREELAKAIAERTGETFEKIDHTMFKCEDIIRGERTNRRETVQLISELRELEDKLGLDRARKARV